MSVVLSAPSRTTKSTQKTTTSSASSSIPLTVTTPPASSSSASTSSPQELFSLPKPPTSSSSSSAVKMTYSPSSSPTLNAQNKVPEIDLLTGNLEENTSTSPPQQASGQHVYSVASNANNVISTSSSTISNISAPSYPSLTMNNNSSVSTSSIVASSPVYPSTVSSSVTVPPTSSTISSSLTSTSTSNVTSTIPSSIQLFANNRFANLVFVRVLVTPKSDLFDLSVKYNVSPSLIRRYNRRVVFDYLDNVVGDYLHIPVDSKTIERLKEEEGKNTQVILSDNEDDEESKEQIRLNLEFKQIENFLFSANRLTISVGNSTSHVESSAEEARFYLEENQFVVEKAIQQFANDVKWEAEEEERQKVSGKDQHIAHRRNHKTKNKSQSMFPNSSASSSSTLPFSSSQSPSNMLQIAEAKHARIKAIAEVENKRNQKVTREYEMERARKAQLSATQNIKKDQKSTSTGVMADGEVVTYNSLPDSDGFFAVRSEPPTIQMENIQKDNNNKRNSLLSSSQMRSDSPYSQQNPNSMSVSSSHYVPPSVSSMSSEVKSEDGRNSRGGSLAANNNINEGEAQSPSVASQLFSCITTLGASSSSSSSSSVSQQQTEASKKSAKSAQSITVSSASFL